MANDLSVREQRLIALVSRALTEDSKAEAEIVAEIAQLAAMPVGSGWPTPSSVLHAVLNELAKETGERQSRSLRRLAPLLLDALSAQPGTMGLPYYLRPASQLGTDAPRLLSRSLDGALKTLSRQSIEALRYGNPGNAPGFAVARDALEHLFAFPLPCDDTTRELLALQWNDERLWLLFRILAGGYGGPAFLRGSFGPSKAARVVLPKLIAATALIEGDGAVKLRALLLREGVIDASLAQGATPAYLPERLPSDVGSALALLETWDLSADDVLAGEPATITELAALQAALGTALPSDLVDLLSVHRTIGERELGPPSQMLELRDDIASTLANHVSEDETSPTGEDQRDVRAFSPTQSIPLGTDASGDYFFLATACKSNAGSAPVIRFHHGECLVATIASDSLAEYVALIFANVYARREGLTPDLDVLARRKRDAPSGMVSPRR